MRDIILYSRNKDDDEDEDAEKMEPMAREILSLFFHLINSLRESGALWRHVSSIAREWREISHREGS